MKIVVIGGSGRVGTSVVRRLIAHGHNAVPASPATGVDTITGEGLADVMADADVVVDVSNAPVWEDDAVREFFTTSTHNLVDAELAADVGHHLAVSDRRRRSPARQRLPAREGRPGSRGSRQGASPTPSCVRRSSSSSCPRLSSPEPRTAAFGCRRGCCSSSPPTTLRRP